VKVVLAVPVKSSRTLDEPLVSATRPMGNCRGVGVVVHPQLRATRRARGFGGGEAPAVGALGPGEYHPAVIGAHAVDPSLDGRRSGRWCSPLPWTSGKRKAFPAAAVTATAALTPSAWMPPPHEFQVEVVSCHGFEQGMEGTASARGGADITRQIENRGVNARAARNLVGGATDDIVEAQEDSLVITRARHRPVAGRSAATAERSVSGAFCRMLDIAGVWCSRSRPAGRVAPIGVPAGTQTTWERGRLAGLAS